MNNFNPRSDYIVLEDVQVKQAHSDLIFIPGTAKQKLFTAIVRDTGPGSRYKGMRIPMSVKKGDRVVFGKGLGKEVIIGEKKCLLMRESEILGKYKNANN